MLRRRDENATRNDVARSDIRASTVTRYKDCTRFVLRIRYLSRSWIRLRFAASNRGSFPFGGTRGVLSRLCNCAVCYPRFSIFRIPRFDWSISRSTTRLCIDTDGTTAARETNITDAADPVRLKESQRSTSS